MIFSLLIFFYFQYRNANPVIWPFWDRKFPIRHSWHIPNPVRITLFPHSWLSSWDKKKILHSRLRRSWRIFFLPRLLSQSWGKSVTCTGFGMCHSWLIRNFKNPSLPASPVVKDFSVPKWPNDRIKPVIGYHKIVILCLEMNHSITNIPKSG